jgi:hypothetical protein
MYPASVGGSPNWALSKHGGQQKESPPASKGKQLYSALYGVYTRLPHNLREILKESAVKGERAKTTITAPPSIEKFREQR